MTTNFCGFDFGTSNSTLGVIEADTPKLISLEADKNTIPTALFFSFETDETLFGREAMEEYLEGGVGRLMTSLKSVLGTSLMHDHTQIKRQQLKFVDIISSFLAEIKGRAELVSNTAYDKVVLGRPIFFVDDDPAADSEAQAALEQAAVNAGFSEVAFQYEPIAAALEYERQITKPEIALIVDLGGGTSDFSVIKLSPDRDVTADRKSDILSNGGIHIGGTNFDKQLSMHSVMPHFGYQTAFAKRPELEIPNYYYHHLSTWHEIQFLYTTETITNLKQIAPLAAQRELINRLISLIQTKQCHRLAIDVEGAKIALTDNLETALPIDFLNSDLNDFDIAISQANLNSAIAEDTSRLQSTIQQTIASAGLQNNQISTIFMTGGSTSIPYISQSILSLFPDAAVVNGDKFGSVGLGLALDAKRKFG